MAKVLIKGLISETVVDLIKFSKFGFEPDFFIQLCIIMDVKGNKMTIK